MRPLPLEKGGPGDPEHTELLKLELLRLEPPMLLRLEEEPMLEEELMLDLLRMEPLMLLLLAGLVVESSGSRINTLNFFYYPNFLLLEKNKN